MAMRQIQYTHSTTGRQSQVCSAHEHILLTVRHSTESGFLRILPKQAFTIEEKLMVRSTARGEFQEACWSCKSMLCNLYEHGGSQAPHKEVVVLKVMEPILYPLPVSIFICVTGHIFQEGSQWHVKHSIDFTGIGCKSINSHQSANDRSNLQREPGDTLKLHVH